MSPRDRILTVRVDSDLSEAMAVVNERHGTPVSEQVRRALRMWLQAQGVLGTSKPATTPKRRKAKTT
jgi:hypothetical protein